MEQKNNNNQGNNKGGVKPPKRKNNFYWIYAVAIGLLLMASLSRVGGDNAQGESIQMNELLRMVQQQHVEEIIVVNDDYAEVYIKEEFQDNYPELKGDKPGFGFGETQNFLLYDGTIEDLGEKVYDAQSEMEFLDKSEWVDIKRSRRVDYTGQVLGWVIPIGIFILIWVFLMRRMSGGGAGGGGQIFNIGKSKAQLFDQNTNVKVTFNDVAGLNEAKVEVMEIVDFLKNPKKYTTLGGKIPKGALLVGPPGTGKTLLAKAVAGEAKVPFFSLSGSDFVEMFVGVGASRVRDLFKQAKEKSPCIVFIDEIDAIGRSRGRNQVTGANDERENTLNQLLTEMDGFSGNQGVIILAATNRADVLDRALMRAGRFDRQIHVELPDLTERAKIFAVHVKPLKMSSEVDIDKLSKQTPGFSGADIANVCNEAALIAARRNSKEINMDDFNNAVDRIIGGLEKRSKLISPLEKSVIAHHEAGHASVSWLLEHASPLVKVTIIPRGKALGAAWYLPEERQITTYDQMFDEMTSLLGGRAAEELIFNRVSTGALNDLERVTKQAYAMISYFGLNPKIGNISYYDSSGQSEYSFSKPYSEKTAEIIDAEVHKLVEQAYDRALSILRENMDKLKQLADKLLAEEVIFTEDVEKIFGKRPFKVEERVPAYSGSKQKSESLADDAEVLPEEEKKEGKKEQKEDTLNS